MSEIISNGVHYRIINFILFVGMLVYFLRTPLKDFWIARALAIKHMVEKSLRLKEEAEKNLAVIEKRFSKIDAEVQALVKDIEAETISEKKQIEEDAKNVIKKIQLDTEKIAEQEIKRARESLKADVVFQAIHLAEKLIREKITPNDQLKLAERFVKQASEKTFQEIRGGL